MLNLALSVPTYLPGMVLQLYDSISRPIGEGIGRGFLNGADVWGSFDAVLDDVAERHPDFDLLAITGDVAQDEQLSTYLRLRTVLGSRGWLDRTRLIPGNHESRQLMSEAFPELFADEVIAQARANCFAVTLAGWRVIGVDTHDTDASEGWSGDTTDPIFQAYGWDGQKGVVQAEQYKWLKHELVGAKAALVFMHHPPVDINVGWLDEVKLESAETFRRIVAEAMEFAPVSIGGIFAGHVHQDRRAELDGIPVYTVPSTAYQSGDQPGVPCLEGEGSLPGYRCDIEL